jgi:hypothetical protein
LAKTVSFGHRAPPMRVDYQEVHLLIARFWLLKPTSFIFSGTIYYIIQPKIRFSVNLTCYRHLTCYRQKNSVFRIFQGSRGGNHPPAVGEAERQRVPPKRRLALGDKAARRHTRLAMNRAA